MIGIDFDDALYPFLGTFLNYLASERGFKRVGLHDCTSYELNVILGISQRELDALMDDFDRTSVAATPAPLGGAQAAVDRLWHRDKNLVIITSRATDGRAFVERWLDEYFPRRFTGIHFAHNPFSSRPDGVTKSSIALKLQLACMIEDAAHHATDVAVAGIPVTLLDKPWNQGAAHELITRVDDWYQVALV